MGGRCAGGQKGGGGPRNKKTVTAGKKKFHAKRYNTKQRVR